MMIALTTYSCVGVYIKEIGRSAGAQAGYTGKSASAAKIQISLNKLGLPRRNGIWITKCSKILDFFRIMTGNSVENQTHFNQISLK